MTDFFASSKLILPCARAGEDDFKNWLANAVQLARTLPIIILQILGL